MTTTSSLTPLDYACRACDTMMRKYVAADLDDIQPGILLYTLLDATGDEKYIPMLHSVAAQTGLLGAEALEAARRERHIL